MRGYQEQAFREGIPPRRAGLFPPEDELLTLCAATGWKPYSKVLAHPTADGGFVFVTVEDGWVSGENAIQHGNPVILEDATETFDPLLDPILGKQVEIQGKEKTIKVSDKVVSFSDEFIFYVTTKMDSPHYSPETCVKMTMLNFMVT